MKKLILCLMIALGNTAWANVPADSINPQQEIKLLKLLQQLEPEMVEELLSEEGYEWYQENTLRFESKTLSSDDDSFDSHTQPTNIGYGSMKDDENAPKFN